MDIPRLIHIAPAHRADLSARTVGPRSIRPCTPSALFATRPAARRGKSDVGEQGWDRRPPPLATGRESPTGSSVLGSRRCAQSAPCRGKCTWIGRRRKPLPRRHRTGAARPSIERSPGTRPGPRACPSAKNRKWRPSGRKRGKRWPVSSWCVDTRDFNGAAAACRHAVRTGQCWTGQTRSRPRRSTEPPCRLASSRASARGRLRCRSASTGDLRKIRPTGRRETRTAATRFLFPPTAAPSPIRAAEARADFVPSAVAWNTTLRPSGETAKEAQIAGERRDDLESHFRSVCRRAAQIRSGHQRRGNHPDEIMAAIHSSRS